MKKFAITLLVVISLVLAAGCEEEDNRSSAPASDTQVANLQTSVDNIGGIGDMATDASSAQSAQGTLGGLYGSYDALINETTAADAAEGSGLVQQAEALTCGTGSAEWTESEVTYDNCDGLTGSVSWSGDTFTIDITYDFGAQTGMGLTGEMTYTGSITITDTMIDGDLALAYAFTSSAMGITVDYDSSYEITYDEIGLDADGCPESGALDLKGHWGYETEGYSGNENFHITAEFNACGDATITS